MSQAQRAGAQQRLAHLQPAGQRGEQALRGEGQAFGEFNARRQFQPGGETFGKDKGALRIGQFAAGAQQLVDRTVADAPTQAGRRGQFAEMAQAEGFQTGYHLGRPAGHGTRQIGQRRL